MDQIKYFSLEFRFSMIEIQVCLQVFAHKHFSHVFVVNSSYQDRVIIIEIIPI